jgi:hypothetical protein
LSVTFYVFCGTVAFRIKKENPKVELVEQRNREN